MKVKTSVTLSHELVNTIDNFSGQFKNRSLFLEQAAWAYIADLKRKQRDARDLEILNQQADYLNDEFLDTEIFQTPL